MWRSGPPTIPRQFSSSSIVDKALVGDVVILLCCEFKSFELMRTRDTCDGLRSQRDCHQIRAFPAQRFSKSTCGVAPLAGTKCSAIYDSMTKLCSVFSRIGRRRLFLVEKAANLSRNITSKTLSRSAQAISDLEVPSGWSFLFFHGRWRPSVFPGVLFSWSPSSLGLSGCKLVVSVVS